MLFFQQFYSVIISLLHHFADLYCLQNRSIYLHPSPENARIYQFIFISPLCKVYWICCITLQIYIVCKTAQYISISRKHTDLSMHFRLSVMQGIFGLLHHFADLIFLHNRLIYLHLPKTHGFINAFSTPDYASYIQPPASYAPLRPSCERYALAFPVVAVHMLFPSIIWSSPRRPTVPLERIIE